MRKIFIEHYQECTESHTPNETTKKALENIKKFEKAETIEEFFKKLGQ